MFFVLRILLVSIYVSEINNFIVRKASQGINKDVNKTEHISFQDIQNTSTALPTLKSLFITQKITNKERLNLNKFDKRIYDEILIKRHIHEKDMPLSMFKSTKNSIATTLELKQKWPVVELLSESDEIKDNSQYYDEVEKKPFPFFHDVDNESKIIELSPETVNNYNIDEQNNQSNEKTVGLRSLHSRGHGFTKQGDDDCLCEISQRSMSNRCPSTKECTRTTVSFPFMPIYMPYDMFNIPKLIPARCPTAIPTTTTTSIPRFTSPSVTWGTAMGFPMAAPMGVPMGVQVGFPVGIPPNFPMGFSGVGQEVYPAGIPHSYYQLNAHKHGPKKKKPSTAKLREELYYDSDRVESIDKYYIYNDDDVNRDFAEKKRKNEKKYKGDMIIDITYDEEPKEQKLSWNSRPVQDCSSPIQETAEKIFKAVCNDLKISYGETVIKDWYCSSAYCVKSRIVFFLVTVVFLLK